MYPNQELAPPTGLIVLIHHKWHDGRWDHEWTTHDRLLADAEAAADVVAEAVESMRLEHELRSCNRPEQHIRVIGLTGEERTSEVLDIVAARFLANIEDRDSVADWVEARRGRVRGKVREIEADNRARLDAALARMAAA